MDTEAALTSANLLYLIFYSALGFLEVEEMPARETVEDRCWMEIHSLEWLVGDTVGPTRKGYLI